MAPKYTLHYFNVRAAGETARWLFALKGVDYEDKRYARGNSDEWVEFKPKTPYGQMPVLEVDGKMICQSNAIVLYLAQEFGYNGETELARVEGAMIAGCIDDTMRVHIDSCISSNNDIKAAKAKEFLETAVPNLLKFLSSQLKGKDWLTGSKMTAADILVARTLSEFPSPAVALVKDYPDVQAQVDKVLALPAIKAWIEKRPVTTI